jgi:hypothetical protein
VAAAALHFFGNIWLSLMLVMPCCCRGSAGGSIGGMHVLWMGHCALFFFSMQWSFLKLVCKSFFLSDLLQGEILEDERRLAESVT